MKKFVDYKLKKSARNEGNVTKKFLKYNSNTNLEQGIIVAKK